MSFKNVRKAITTFLVTTIVSSLLPTDVFARTVATPTWYSAIPDTSGNSVFLNWNATIPEEDIFFTEDFSSIYADFSKQDIIEDYCVNCDTGVNGWRIDFDGNTRSTDDPYRNSLKIIDGVGKDGTRGVIAHNSKQYGYNYIYWGDGTVSDINPYSNMSLLTFKQVKEGRPAIVQLDSKGTANIRTGVNTGWFGNSEPLEGITWAENLTADELLERVHNYQPIKVNNATGTTYGGIHIVTNFDPNFTYNFRMWYASITQASDGQWYINVRADYTNYWTGDKRPNQTVTQESDKMVQSISEGQQVYWMPWGMESSFGKVLTSNDWVTTSHDIILPTGEYFRATGRYVKLFFQIGSEGDFCMDNMTVGYAQKAHIYRDGNIIWSGYGAEYIDTNIDTTPPSFQTNSIQQSIDKDSLEITIGWDRAEDVGTSHTYQIQTEDSDGYKSSLSEPREVTVTSGFNHYEVISNGRSYNTTDNSITLPAEEVRDFKVCAVDNAGNKSQYISVANPEIIDINSNQTVLVTGTYAEPFSELNLPSVLNCSTNYGETTLGVTWNSSTYSPTEAISELTGTVQLNGLLNTANKYATASVTLSKASLNNSDTINFSSTPIQLTHIYGTDETISDILEDYSETTVTKNGVSLPVTITWDTSNVDLNQLGDYLMEGACSSDYIDNLGTVRPTINLSVISSEIVTIASIPTIEKRAFTTTQELDLPNKVMAVFDNGKNLECTVDWDTGLYSPTDILNLQTLQGTLELPYGYSNYSNKQAIVDIQLSAATITGFAEPLYIETEYGTPLTQLSIPTTLVVQNDSGHEQVVNVEFDCSTYNPLTLGTQTFTGRLLNNILLANINNIEPKLTIEVTPANIDEINDPDLEIEGFLGKQYSSLGLPDNINVKLSSGIDIDLPISWNESDYSNKKLEQTLDAVIELPSEITNILQLTPHANIHLSPTEDKHIIDVEPLPRIVISKGTEISNIPYLYEVTAFLSNNTKTTIPVAYWDSVNIDVNQIGTYEAKATLLSDDNYNVTQSIEVVDVSNPSSLKEVLKLNPIQITLGEEVILPECVTGILTNGNIISIPVDFESLPTVTEPGVYYIEGNLQYNNNPLNLNITQEIDVIDITEDIPYIVEILDSDVVQAPVGTSFSDIPTNNVIKARLSDNRWVYTTIDISNHNYNPNTTDLQSFTGTLLTPTSYTNPLQLSSKTYIKLYDSSSYDVTKIHNPAEIVVPYNTQYKDLELPLSKVELLGGYITYLATTWNLSKYDPLKVGIQTFRGYFNDVNSALVPQLQIKVLPYNPNTDNSTIITSIEAPKDISVMRGNILKKQSLPTALLCETASGEVIKLPVAWIYSDSNVLSDITIQGEVSSNGYIFQCSPTTEININCVTGSGGSGGNHISSKQEVDEPKPTPTVAEVTDVIPKSVNDISDMIPFTLPMTHKLLSKTDINITPTNYKNGDIVGIVYKDLKYYCDVKCQVIEPFIAKMNFKDISKSHWAYNSVSELFSRGYVQGTTENSFSPNNTICVADTFSFIDRILLNNNYLEMKQLRSTIQNLHLDSNNWAYYNVSSILSKLSKETISYLSATPDIYKYNLTREEVARVLYDILYDNTTIQPSSPTFTDTATITYRQQVSYCTALGLFEGDNQNHFNPKQKITRAELVTVLTRLDNLLKNK